MRIIIKNNRNLWIAVLAALIPFVLISSTTLVMIATGEATPDEMALPFLAMSIFSVLILLLFAVPMIVMGSMERATITRLMNGDAWATWEQFDTQAEWHAFAEAEYERAKAATRLRATGVVALIIMSVFVGGFLYFYLQTQRVNILTIVVPVGAMFAVIFVLVIGSWIVEIGKNNKDYQNRLSAPIPKVYIGKKGYYHEDKGYQNFRDSCNRLINVYFEDGTPPTLNLQINKRVRRYLWYKDLDKINVPRGSESEAQNIAHRYFDEGVLKR